MSKKTLRDVELKGRRVLMRVDFNVPIQGGKVADDTRITAAMESIRYVLEKGGSLVLMSHLGRPNGKPEPKYSLKPAADRLSQLLGKPVGFAPDCVGDAALQMAQALKPGDVLLLENLRFHLEEEGKPDLPKDVADDVKKAAKAEMKIKQKEFAAKLARLGDVYANDAFGTAHRAHASIAVVTEHFKDKLSGFLMEKEIRYLSQALHNPAKPFIAIIGGAKISDKIEVLNQLMDKADAFLIGGGMAYTFYKAKGLPIGKSLLEPDKLDVAREILGKAEKAGVKFLLPVDHVVADAFSATANNKIVGESGIEDEWMALDIGPESVKLFSAEIAKAKTIVWNGPMGCFEMAPFANGTMSMVKAIAANPDCTSIIGGGDSVSAVNKSGLAGKMTHISTGGGASLEFLEGRELPGVKALSDNTCSCCG